ncbi:MAG: DUF423 domain-containing protein [Pirellula sp.]|jgi:uncharacterized membrane protein YgdD (TMEM256/DUF423 family)|nr:DUF423 domain-containing protein [Pirellula sp.]
MNTFRWLLLLAGISGAIAVGIGAIGAHSLPKQLEKRGLSPELITKKLEQCELGVRYQMYHALAILSIALWGRSAGARLLGIACVLFLLGTLCFSGGLYSIVFADEIIHWSIVPIGGSTLILGWLCVAMSAIASSSEASAGGR